MQKLAGLKEMHLETLEDSLVFTEYEYKIETEV